MAGYKAFQSKFLGSDLLDEQSFTNFNSRKLRYAILWAMYENNAYSKMQIWSQAYKSEYGLYRYTRNIYSPAYRIGEFWKSHLLAGKLDPDAGDGIAKPSALPIITDIDALRPAISQVWRWSNWQVQKDITSLWTSVMGDGVLQIIDDEVKGRVYIKPVNPGTLKDVEMDDFGNVKGYTLEEQRPDPRSGRHGSFVTYREIVYRDGDSVVYETYLNESLYAWDGESAEWSIEYGFVPMVVFQHNNVGLDFGWSELHPGLSKFREVDDLASKLSDQVRKMVDAPWLFSGVSAPATTPKTSGTTPSTNNPQSGREEVPALYGPVGSDAKPLVAPLSIADSAQYIENILKVIEEDYPELNTDIHNVSGDISGRALRINRGPAETKVLQRRPNYDDALMRAQQMAVAIGGFRKYEKFTGFDLDSYGSGKLDHQIGDRPVFEKDPTEDLERDGQFWKVAEQAKTFGVPPLVYLKMQGWDKTKIAEIENSAEYKAHLAALEAASNATKEPSVPSTNRFGNNDTKDNATS